MFNSIDSKPRFDNLVSLPYQPEILLCPNTKTRWKFEQGQIYRDLEGEGEWSKMADYVGKTYDEVFMDSYKYALNSR